MSKLKSAELFAGSGALSLAVNYFFDSETQWISEFDKYASHLLDVRLGKPNIGDISKTDFTKLDKVGIIAGGSPCFTAGTLIETENGLTPIEEVKLGTLVRTHNGRYKPVTQVMSRNTHGDSINVKVMGSPVIHTTKEHPFYVRTKDKGSLSDPVWKAAGELTKDDYVGFQFDDESEDPEITLQEAYIIGRWLGDGWVINSKRKSNVPQGKRGSRVTSKWWKFIICSSHNEADSLLKKFEEAGFRPTVSVERTATKFTVHSKRFVGILNEFGKGASNKSIPDWVFRTPISFQKAILDGYIDADGSVQKNGQIRATSVSEKLIHSMARIARNVHRIGVSVHKFSVPGTKYIEGRLVNQKPQYQLCIPTTNKVAIVDGDWVWTPVRSISEATDTIVHNIGVKDDESYRVNGIAVHNCQDVSLSGQRKGMVEGTRSNLWVSMVECINEIQPSLVVWENVRGALSAKAYSKVEQSEGRMGKNLTALGRVLGDLSDIGYDAQWRIVRASDIGAPHQRERVFVLAWKRDSDPSSFRWDSWREESIHITQFSDYLKRLGSSGFYGSSSDTYGIESFGEYQGRVRYWEDVTGVLAPIPSRLPNKGRYNISSKFSEWMMGIPEGWVTGDDLGLSNRQQLKIIGNAVVPLQALLALQELSKGMKESLRNGM